MNGFGETIRDTEHSNIQVLNRLAILTHVTIGLVRVMEYASAVYRTMQITLAVLNERL